MPENFHFLKNKACIADGAVQLIELYGRDSFFFRYKNPTVDLHHLKNSLKVFIRFVFPAPLLLLRQET